MLRCQFVTSAFNLHRDNCACQPPLYHALLFGLCALLQPGYPYARGYKPVAERCPVTMGTQSAPLSHSSLTPLYISYFLVGFSILKVNWWLLWRSVLENGGHTHAPTQTQTCMHSFMKVCGLPFLAFSVTLYLQFWEQTNLEVGNQGRVNLKKKKKAANFALFALILHQFPWKWK